MSDSRRGMAVKDVNEALQGAQMQFLYDNGFGSSLVQNVHGLVLKKDPKARDVLSKAGLPTYLQRYWGTILEPKKSRFPASMPPKEVLGLVKLGFTEKPAWYDANITPFKDDKNQFRNPLNWFMFGEDSTLDAVLASQEVNYMGSYNQFYAENEKYDTPCVDGLGSYKYTNQGSVDVGLLDGTMSFHLSVDKRGVPKETVALAVERDIFSKWQRSFDLIMPYYKKMVNKNLRNHFGPRESDFTCLDDIHAYFRSIGVVRVTKSLIELQNGEVVSLGALKVEKLHDAGCKTMWKTTSGSDSGKSQVCYTVRVSTSKKISDPVLSQALVFAKVFGADITIKM